MVFDYSLCIKNNNDYGHFFWLLAYDYQILKQSVESMKHYSIAYGFFSLNEDNKKMRKLEELLKSFKMDWKTLDEVKKKGVEIARKSCIVDNLINAMIGKERVYNF